MGDAWDSGAEAVVDYLSRHGVAAQVGEGEHETVAFLSAPGQAFV